MRNITLILIAVAIAAVFSSFVADGIKGRWEYVGGIYNGKLTPASKDYVLQRNYDASHYSALLLEKGQAPYNYERGSYRLDKDTCSETQTFSAEPSKWLNVTIKYKYEIKNDTLTFSGVLPNGTIVQEKWLKVK
ncbi:hypothetical protein FPZ43_02060 [Mucilaginibacter pallidiroseus]|uniref:Lipocalin-like domain-containing protein n=1 Tax=Mucilaginibacter pallidiroseus TaxID=2599295 RepID=A0A563UJ04_9SPHI|nr:hypothetical protein [Mucilaginibacter pallidiroseus]TWR31283.1 hypothetical protein FPZ43_02060 [Mucilaginibacter pallidiroseus]